MKRESKPRQDRERLGGRAVALTDPVRVCVSGNPGQIAVAKSVLRSAGVPFVALNEVVQSLVGPAILAPVEIFVSRADAVDARLLLEELGSVEGA